MKNENMINQSKLLERGWSRKMIETLLPEPDYFRNPHYSSAAPMKKWKMEDVEKAEETNVFKEYLKEREKRKEIAEKAVATKYRNTARMIEQQINRIQVDKVDDDTLTKMVIEQRNEWYEYQYVMREQWRRFDTVRTAEGADENTMKRWKVNYIRHQLTDYDQTMFEGKGNVGFKYLQFDYRRAVMMKIAETYPYLKEECEKQISTWEETKREEP